MHLARHTIESHAAAPVFNHASFSSSNTSEVHDSLLSQPSIAACAMSNGFLVVQTDPLKLVARNTWSAAQGELSCAVPVQHTSLLVLVGGGRVPRFAPNKVVLWDEAVTYASPSSSKGKEREHRHAAEPVSESTHSTLFSAGSEFEAYGRFSASLHDDGITTDTSSQHIRTRSSSPTDSLRFSRSSLDESDGVDLPAMGESRSIDDDLESSTNSMYTSSIGIGRMQAGADPSASALRVAETNSCEADLAETSFSISASSANLDDPFALDDPATSDPSGLTDSDKPGLTGLFHSKRRIPRVDKLGHGAEHASVITSAMQRSVSSLATADTQATTRPPRKQTKGKEVAELEFSEIVRGVHVASLDSRSVGAVMVVTLSTKAVIFELRQPQPNAVPGLQTTSWTITKRASVQTYKNPKGLGAIAATQENTSRQGCAVIIAVPGKQKGHVQILRVKPQDGKLSSPAIGAASIIVAHKASLACMTLSSDGSLLATASSKGTILRVWSNNVAVAPHLTAQIFSAHGATVSKAGRTGFGATLVRELRRGTDPAHILSIAFAPDRSAVAVASDKGTIHIFELSDLSTSLSQAQTDPACGNTGTKHTEAPRALSGASRYVQAGLTNLAGQIPPSMLPQYFNSEWSSAQFRIPLKTFGSHARRAWSGDLASRTPGATTSFGSEKSTEGAWAKMRGRVGDIRKGEAGVDEAIFLCWIREAPSPTTSGSKSDKARQNLGRNKGTNTGRSVNGTGCTDTSSEQTHMRLLALTTSGGWYKIALDVLEAPSEASTVLNMYRNDTSDNTKPLSDKVGFGCHLVEYRPILTTLDSWHI